MAGSAGFGIMPFRGTLRTTFANATIRLSVATPMSRFPTLSPELAASFADIALANVVREYPEQARPRARRATAIVARPRELHPAFYGSFDWHSCVHMHWLLARVRRLFPDLPQRAAIDALFDRHLTPPNIAAECAYLARPERAVVRAHLRLGVAARSSPTSSRAATTPTRGAGRAALAPLARRVRRALPRLPAARQHYPMRHGMHSEQRVRARCSRSTTRGAAGDDALAALVRRHGARMVRRRSRCAGGVGAVGRRLPVAGADRGGADAARAAAGRIRGVARRRSCRGSPRASRRRCSRRSRSTIAATRTSCISTVSTCRARGACAASRRRCRRTIRARPLLRDAAGAPSRRRAWPALASGDYAGEHWLATFARARARRLTAA